jgi:hypothetical protein
MIISAASSAEALYQQSIRLDGSVSRFPQLHFAAAGFLATKKLYSPFARGCCYPDI